MQRKTTTSSRPRRRMRRRDDTWVVKEDEFHPDHRVAACEADKLAREAALKNARVERERCERRAESARLSGDKTLQAVAIGEAAAWEAETTRILGEISDTKEEDDA